MYGVLKGVPEGAPFSQVPVKLLDGKFWKLTLTWQNKECGHCGSRMSKCGFCSHCNSGSGGRSVPPLGTGTVAVTALGTTEVPSSDGWSSGPIPGRFSEPGHMLGVVAVVGDDAWLVLLDPFSVSSMRIYN